MNNIQQLERRAISTQWYKQAAAVKPLYIGYPWVKCFRFAEYGKVNGQQYKNMSVYYRRAFMDVYFPVPVMEGLAQHYWQKEKRGHQISRLKKHWQSIYVKPFLKEVRILANEKLRPYETEKLINRFLKFSQVYNRLWTDSIFLDAFDCAGHDLFLEIRKKTAAKLDGKTERLLTASEQWSWLQKEKRALLGLTASAAKNAKLKKAVLSGQRAGVIAKTFPIFSESLTQHARDFHWIYNDYAKIRRLHPQFFLDRIREFLRDTNLIRQESADLRAVASTSRAKTQLVKRTRLRKEMFRVANFLVMLADWRDSRKAYTQMAGPILQKFAKEFSRRFKLNMQIVENLFWFEISSLTTQKKRLSSTAEKRLKGAFITGPPARPRNSVYGSTAKDLHSLFEERIASQGGLTGMPAYPGLATGTVKIVRDQSEFKKMRPGDILVAPNTRPEYVPIMKIAGAIIAEEGGITSHAAIVSRELKIPCIVGVQSARLNLKDGDKVEVNATEGAIKKLIGNEDI